MQANKALLLSNMLSSTESIENAEIANFEASCVTPLDITVDIDPVQDLHGFDNPWPGGGGKNKYNADTKIVGQALNTANGGLYSNANWEASDYIPATEGNITLSWDSGTNYYQANICAYDANKAFISDSGIGYTGYAYSHTYAVPTGTTFVRFSWAKSVSGTDYPRTNIRVNVGSSDLGYAPYSNVCPISGWDGAKVTRTGRNLLKVKYPGRTHNGVTYVTNEDGTITLTGTASGSSYFASNYGFYTDYMVLFPPGTYTMSGSPNTNIRVYGTKFALDGTNLGTINQDTGSGSTFTIVEPTWFNPQVYVASGASTNLTIGIQVQVGSQKTAYEPYTAVTHEIPFSTEVYGGKLNVETGKLVVTHQIVDMGTLTWSAESGAFSALVNGMKMYPASEKADMISSHYKTVTQNNVFGVDKSISSTNWRGAVILKDTSYSSATAVKEGVNGVQLCYPLATPITLTLDPVEIRSLLGDNNVWSDTGNVSVRNITCNADVLELLLKTKLIGDC